MLQSNHRLVLSICSKYTNKGHGVSTQDLVTEGIQGLLKGVEKFDPSKGFKFSTYAHWWIRQAVTRAISEQSRAVRVPAHLYENYQKVQVAKAELLVDLGREPTMAEVSKRTGLSPKHILQVANLALSSVSLDAPLSDDSGASTKGDTIEDNLRATADEVLENEMLKRDIGLMLDELDEKEAGIVKLRFGLLEEIDDAHTSNSLKSIGEKFNVTRERIRQIEAKAVRKLRQRHATNGSVLNDYLTSVASHELVMRRSQGTNKT
jgi:RNA polymerase primary sigma factor